MKEEVRLMKGNEAIAHAAIRFGFDGYFGYPITPQSEVLETLEEFSRPGRRPAMVGAQAESEVAAINMVYGGAAALKGRDDLVVLAGRQPQAGGHLLHRRSVAPGAILNVMRGGPGLGTIQPSQADYFQATKGGGHGDYHLIVLAPSTVQEMVDFVGLGMDLAFKYSNPAMILADGIVGR